MTSTKQQLVCGNLDRQQLGRRRLILGGMAAAVSASLAGCGGGAEVLLFAPVFAFIFQGVIEREIVSVNFSPASSGQSSGNFDSTSNISGTTIDSRFTGSFTGRDLELTMATPTGPLAQRYRGRFTHDDTILLTPSSGAGTAFSINRSEGFVPTLTGNWAGTDGAGNALRWRLDTDPATPDDQVTVFLNGTELRGTAAAAAITGFASVRQIELNITRASGTVRLTGRLAPAAQGPQTTATILIDGGGSLVRA